MYAEIKLLNLKYIFRPLRQTTSWETQKATASVGEGQQRAMSCDNEPQNNHVDEGVECSEGGNWSSDASNSDDEEHTISVRN